MIAREREREERGGTTEECREIRREKRAHSTHSLIMRGL
jgi:hypothetical protein